MNSRFNNVFGIISLLAFASAIPLYLWALNWSESNPQGGVPFGLVIIAYLLFGLGIIMGILFLVWKIILSKTKKF